MDRINDLHVLLLAALLVSVSACTRTETVQEPVRAARTLTVAVSDVGGSIEYAADIRARTESRLGFRVAGKLRERKVEVGQAVKAGQVLASIDPTDLQLAQDAALATRHAAEVALELASADLKRTVELRDKGFVSAAELERRESTVKSAQAQLEQARAQARVQGNQATYSVLVAPQSGVVVAVEAEVGAVLAAGTPVFRMANDGPRDAVFSVPEGEVDRLRALIGRPAAVAVRLWTGGPSLPATVREVGAAADSTTRTFLVKADIAGGVPSLGQTATVVVPLPRSDGLIRLPLTAVRESQGQSAVWVVDKTSLTVHSRVVDLSGADGNQLVVRQGLAPGDIVVTAGVHVLGEGQKVRLLAAGGGGTSAAPAASAASR